MKSETSKRPRFDSIDLEGCDKIFHGAYNYSKQQAEKCMKVQSKETNTNKEKRILLINTGGTIGMEKTANGLAPKKNFLYNYLLGHPNFCDKEFTMKEIMDNKLESDYIITPVSIYNKRVYYRILEFDHIIDSANMNLDYWKLIGNAIHNNYNLYDGFVIIHGTDTMNYTASILSFQLENLNKPVILTGSQIPLAEMRNDGIKNLVDSLTIAAIFHVPEVCVMFNGNLFRGNRTIKNDNINYDAFESPNLRPLIEIGIFVKVNWDLILPQPTEEFNYFDVLFNII
jgi:lysophospholipase